MEPQTTVSTDALTPSTSPIQNGINLAKSRLVILEEALTTLLEKLSPVMSTSEPRPMQGDEPEEKRVHSSIVADLNNIEARISASAERVQIVLERLQV